MRGRFLENDIFSARRVRDAPLSLDFLGFPSEFESFQRVTRRRARIFFRSAFGRVSSAGRASAAGCPAVLALRKGRIVHGTSLTQFLIICNRLSPRSASCVMAGLVPATTMFGAENDCKRAARSKKICSPLRPSAALPGFVSEAAVRGWPGQAPPRPAGSELPRANHFSL